jgi:mRNA-degrading endonuclease RelE of RelBE toxin-antitoxin system
MERELPPSYYVEISERASQDLQAIAIKDLDAVHDALDALEKNPRYPGARRRKQPGHYSLRVGSYRIRYAVNEEARLITIQRVIPYRPRRSDPGEGPVS